LLGGDITHLKPLKSTKISLVDLGRDKRFDELFIYLVLRLGFLLGKTAKTAESQRLPASPL
jgi:hypothetical protein